MAALRHVSGDEPGICRRRTGDGFMYVRPSGRPVRDAATLDRIRAIAIPPAWTDVWICPSPEGHLQATGRDARARKQYRYHPAFRAARDEAKYDRLLEFADALPAIRRRVAQDLRRPPSSRPRVLATAVRLLERTLIRIGNDEYARANRSYGLTTLRNRHVRVNGRRIEFAFRAKSGVFQRVDCEDAALARTVRRCQELPGQKLFEYVDADGAVQTLGSSDVNAYLQAIAGRAFTAKDFRTWAGTLLAAFALRHVVDGHPPRSRAARARQVNAAVDHAARALGNTRAVCRKCYIHPAVLDVYLESGETLPLPALDPPALELGRLIGDPDAERALRRFLRGGARRRRARVAGPLRPARAQPGRAA